ncbi:MAG: hypothetical protein NTZ33_15680 [Bacteroidetes bacterium]|nr:hypothetical protein [Bacteroidota bacterium]
MKRLNSFTLSELTVTIIIVLIAVIISYQILRNLYTDFNMFSKNETNTTNILYSYSILSNDFKKSTLIYQKKESLKLITKKQDTISYQSAENKLIRNYNSHLDTLDCTIKEFIYYSAFKDKNIVCSIKVSFNDNVEDDILLIKEYFPENLLQFKSEY